MKTLFTLVALTALAGSVAAQQEKPVPKDSMRLSIPGCTKGVVFTVMESPEHESRSSVPPGRRFRLAGPKALISEIRQQEGTMVEVTGLVRRGQMDQSGISLGGGVRMGPAPSPLGSVANDPQYNQIVIDVEGWRPLAASCPTR